MDESLIFVNIKTFVKMSDFSLSLVSLSKHDNFFLFFFLPVFFLTRILTKPRLLRYDWVGLRELTVKTNPSGEGWTLLANHAKRGRGLPEYR